MFRYTILFISFLAFNLSSAQRIPSFKNDITHLYSGVNNPIEIELNGADLAKIKLKCKDARVAKQNDSLYLIAPKYPEGEVKIKLYYKNLPVDIVSTEVINLPNPEILIETQKLNLLSKSRLSNFLEDLTIHFDEKNERLNKIYSPYSINFSVNKGGIVRPFQIHLHRMNTKIFTDFIQDLKKDDVIFVQSVTMIDENRRTSRFNVNHEFRIE